MPWEWAGLCPQWTLGDPQPRSVPQVKALRVLDSEPLSWRRCQGQRSKDKAQMKSSSRCWHCRKNPRPKTLDRGPPTDTTLGLLLSPWPAARAPASWGQMQAGPGGRPWGTAAHPPPSRARPPGRGPQCGFVWQLAQCTGRVSRAALASRRCQPEGQRCQAGEGGCLLLSPPGSQARCRPENTWAGLAASPDPWDPGTPGRGGRG